MYKDNAETPRSKRACWNRIEAVINMAQMTTNYEPPVRAQKLF